MKTIKLLFLVVALSVVTLHSCSDSDSIKSESTAQKSIALRTVLNELKNKNSIAGRGTNDDINSFCFEFVYPLTFSYNNGTAITAANFEGLIEILTNESPSLYLQGIVFPFQVHAQGALVTIADEEALTTLIQNCSFPTFNDDLSHSFCFDIVFPISIEAATNQFVTIDNLDELHAYLNNPGNGFEAQIVFPITVIRNNPQQSETIIIHSIYEFYQIVNSCSNNTQCICTLEYMPVCVRTANDEIIEFGNLCFAMCAGYTQSDLVACNSLCSIGNLAVTVGNCNPNQGTYALTINFTTTDPNATEFEVVSSGGQHIGNYYVADLPVTIPNYPMSLTAIPTDNFTIKFSESCTATKDWTKPFCNGVCTCPAVVDPVCVRTIDGNIVPYNNFCLAACDGYTQNDVVACDITPAYNFGQLLGTCFSINFPVQIQSQGVVVTANSNGEVLQYWQPTQGQMPSFNYPVTVTFGNSVYTFANQVAFEHQINTTCP